MAETTTAGRSDRIEVGDLYEDCAYHPVLCTLADYEGDELNGISLIDGSQPRSCSPTHCGPVRLTVAEALAIKQDLSAYVAQRVGEAELAIDRASNGERLDGDP